MTATGPVCLCGGHDFVTTFVYTAPPNGEIRFEFSSTDGYRRHVIRCLTCGHFLSVHEMDDSVLYSGDYVQSTYGKDGVQAAFDRIITLPASQSDNTGRTTCILEFAARHLTLPAVEQRRPRVLDVGSGLCVFLHRMLAAGWEGTAVDSDARLVEHARRRVGVDAVCGTFGSISGLGKFDLVAFNKVLEHVRDPLSMLAGSQQHLLTGGFVYVEVPDGEDAVNQGAAREEFFIDHYHIFSAASLTLLATRAGFKVLRLERLQEPSTKYTLRTFLIPAS